MELEWRNWCNGLVLGGFVGGTAMVGISGPHPNRLYSLTFYGGSIASRREVFTRSLAKAQRVAEKVIRIKSMSARFQGPDR